MDIHDIRAKLAKDEPTIGTWLQLPSADVAELMARAGYDWVAVDMEHGSFGRTGLPDIFRAIQCGGAAPFARLPIASRTAIKAALEAGAQGLIFPMIESRAQLDQAISWATYPGHDDGRRDGEPLRENRGVGFCRANAFGRDFDAYMRDTAPRIFLVAQIEHIRAVEELDAILSQPRLDAIMVGPYDLSGSMRPAGGIMPAWACMWCSPTPGSCAVRWRRAAASSPTASIRSSSGRRPHGPPERRAGHREEGREGDCFRRFRFFGIAYL